MVHAVLVRGVTQCLKEIFEDGFYADKVLERTFKNNRKWGSRDRRFVAETVYNMTRWWGLLVFAADGPFVPKTQDEYLLMWAIYESWQNKNDVREFLHNSFSFQFNQHGFLKRLESKKESYIAVAFPEWLYKRFKNNFGDETFKLLQSLNEPAPVCLRANRLKTERERLQKLLQNENVATQFGDSEDALILETRQNVFTTDCFKSGLFEVQDQASQRVSKLLDPKSGERIADMCAGAGGKTLHLAALMKNKGSLFAADISERKLEELKKRAARAGVSNLKVQLIENSKSIKRHADSFDGVLIDAPCSGSGVIRRNPDSKWKLSEEELQRLKILQAEILKSYSRLVKPGGRLVYATCSLLGEENMEQVEAFLRENSEFSKEGEPLLTRPDHLSEDGFFAQKLRRK
jgi:16S rRNA (cytosine967-C5)-methyltransferase